MCLRRQPMHPAERELVQTKQAMFRVADAFTDAGHDVLAALDHRDVPRARAIVEDVLARIGAIRKSVR